MERPDQNQPPRTRPEGEGSCPQLLGEAARGTLGLQTEQPTPWPRQPLELGRGVLLSTRQTKGKERPRWAWKWRVALHSLFRVLYVSPALSRTTVAFGPLDGQDRYALDHKGINLVTCSREMSTRWHQAPGSLYTPPRILPRPLPGRGAVGILHCSLLPLTHQPTLGNKTMWAPPQNPLA